jgi:hypothetical protein
MERSQINNIIKKGLLFLERVQFKLPPFIKWSPEQWAEKGSEYDEIRDCMLGWDVTDFGSGNFDEIGLLVITLRNGIKESDRYNKAYAEKCLILQDNQIIPMHYHYNKMEDIINRGETDIAIQLYNSTPDGDLADTAVNVHVDGRRFNVGAGTVIRLKPGEGVTLTPYQYHKFWAEGGMGLAIEVSMVNDDNTDNHFLKAPARFPEIEEDEPKEYLLFSEYPPAR